MLKVPKRCAEIAVKSFKFQVSNYGHMTAVSSASSKAVVLAGMLTWYVSRCEGTKFDLD